MLHNQKPLRVTVLPSITGTLATMALADPGRLAKIDDDCLDKYAVLARTDVELGAYVASFGELPPGLTFYDVMMGGEHGLVAVAAAAPARELEESLAKLRKRIPSLVVAPARCGPLVAEREIGGEARRPRMRR